MSHSRSTVALSWSRAFSAGAAVASLASVSANMDRSATARGTKGWSRYGEAIGLPHGLAYEASPAAGWRRGLVARRETRGVIRSGITRLMSSHPRHHEFTLALGGKATHGKRYERHRGSCRGLAVRASKDGVNGDASRRGTGGHWSLLRWIGRSYSPPPKGIARSVAPAFPQGRGVFCLE